jgi:galactokinase
LDEPSFSVVFGRSPDVVASAPGRVNLIGEHTDYNGGFVLPAAIPQRAHVELAVREDSRVRAVSAALSTSGLPEEYILGEERRGRGWLDYVQGITHVLAEAGYALPGFDVRVTSTVPVGSGLSSSAALEVALLRALRSALSLTIDDVELALIGQRAENGLVGAPVGIMDQLASSLATEAAALFIDVRDLRMRPVPLPSGSELLVISSGVAHDHASGDYRTRRAQCESAAALLGVDLLRQIAEDDPRLSALPEPLGRRARHVVTENARVLATVAAMERGDLFAVGELFAASHRSMRDDYEVSVPAVDTLVEIAAAHPAVFGARLTGGGFGGSIVALCRAGSAAAAGHVVAETYRVCTGLHPSVLVPPSMEVA